MRKGLLFVFLLISINIFAFDCLNWSIKIEGDSVCCLKQEKVLSVVIVAILISMALRYIPVFSAISSGFAIIICAVAASAIGALLFPVKEDEQ